MQSDTTVVSIAAVNNTSNIIAMHGQKTLHWQLSTAILWYYMYNCNFEAIN